MIKSFLFYLMMTPLAFAGVERFLEPLVLPHNKATYKKTSSGYISGSFHSSSSKIGSFVPSIELDSKILEEKLSELLRHRYQVDGKVVAKIGREWAPLSVSSSFKIKINDCNPDELASSAFLRYSIWDKGTLVGDFSMPLRISHMQDVYFAQSPLSRGTLPTSQSFEFRMVDVLKSHANSVPRGSNLSGYQIDSNLKPGQPLKWNLLSKTTLVKKGDVINVFASGNGIYVSMKGIALEDGTKDSFVRVKNINSQKEFNAKVLNENSVKVSL